MTHIEVPSSIYLTVEFVDEGSPTDILASYSGITLKVEYDEARIQLRNYFSGDFKADYAEALAWAEGWGQADSVVPFFASSTLDTYLYYADLNEDGVGYTEDNANSEQFQAVIDYEAAIKDDLPFLPTTEAEKTVAVCKRLETAWTRVPAVKLQWALANVIASSDYNTEYPHAPLGRDRALQALKVLDQLLADEAFGRAMRP